MTSLVMATLVRHKELTHGASLNHCKFSGHYPLTVLSTAMLESPSFTANPAFYYAVVGLCCGHGGYYTITLSGSVKKVFDAAVRPPPALAAQPGGRKGHADVECPSCLHPASW